MAPAGRAEAVAAIVAAAFAAAVPTTRAAQLCIGHSHTHHTRASKTTVAGPTVSNFDLLAAAPTQRAVRWVPAQTGRTLRPG
eukprot:5045116-Pleurochrysis_carterae.AAC.2